MALPVKFILAGGPRARTLGLTVSDGFSTASIAPAERVDYWREMVRRHFVPLRIEPLGGGEFSGSAKLRSLGSVELLRVRAQPLAASRGWRHIERSASEEYFIAVQLRGLAVARQDDRASALRPGDFALLDSARPYAIEFRSNGPFEHLIVRVPRAQLDARCAGLDRATAVAVSARSEGGRLAGPSLRALAGMRAADTFIEPVLELLARAIAHSAGLCDPPISRRQHALRELKRYALAHAAESGLSPARVAGACFVSVRQLHRLFALEQTTFGAFLKEARLRETRRDLADPALASLTIAEIARRRGFASAAFFSRAFSERYGTGPRTFRQSSARGA